MNTHTNDDGSNNSGNKKGNNNGPELALIIPTFNEANNIEPLLKRLTPALDGIDWEILFIDDNSPDHTADTLQQLSQQDRRIRCIKRLNRRGLSSACIEGFLASQAPFVAVMDADLQHDERLLPQMLDALKNDTADLTVASRFMDNASIGALSKPRATLSRLANQLSRLLKIHTLSDPMSGFFAFKRSALQDNFQHLYGQGFKILVDLVSASKHPLRIQEFPYTMRARHAGSSKLDAMMVAQYLQMLFVKLTHGLIPITFLLFVLVGLSGVGVHLGVLASLKAFGLTHFTLAQSIATFTAMTTNFLLNNIITYRDQRLQGLSLLFGLMSFYIVCSIGALINISFASLLVKHSFSWLFAGATGAVVGAVWNYTMSSIFTWTRTNR